MWRITQRRFKCRFKCRFLWNIRRKTYANPVLLNLELGCTIFLKLRFWAQLMKFLLNWFRIVFQNRTHLNPFYGRKPGHGQPTQFSYLELCSYIFFIHLITSKSSFVISLIQEMWSHDGGQSIMMIASIDFMISIIQMINYDS